MRYRFPVTASRQTLRSLDHRLQLKATIRNQPGCTNLIRAENTKLSVPSGKAINGRDFAGRGMLIH